MTEKFDELSRIAGSVSRETFERLEQFEALFLKWSAALNLASSTTRDDVWRRHILDSAQLRPLAPNALRWMDIGSGGGFPGIIMAILLAECPDACVELVESSHKKAGFLRAAVGGLMLPAQVHAHRIGELEGVVAPPDIVTARAVAPLGKLLQLASYWLGTGATALFHKGRDYRSEVTESLTDWSFDLVEHQSRIDRSGAVLEIRNLRRR